MTNLDHNDERYVALEALRAERAAGRDIHTVEIRHAVTEQTTTGSAAPADQGEGA